MFNDVFINKAVKGFLYISTKNIFILSYIFDRNIVKMILCRFIRSEFDEDRIFIPVAGKFEINFELGYFCLWVKKQDALTSRTHHVSIIF